MSSDEKLPAGWAKVQSRSRPDKFYYHNQSLKLSLWKLEDLRKFQSRNESVTAKSTVPETPTKSPAKVSRAAAKRPTPGVSNQSKVIKKNGARDRMQNLQKHLAYERKHDTQMTNGSAKKHESSNVSKSSYRKPNDRKAIDKKNVALDRMTRLNQQIDQEKKQEAAGSGQAPAASTSLKPAATKVEMPEADDELMDVSFGESESYEAMDWEDVPELEVINEVQKIRTLKTSANPSLVPHALSSAENAFPIIVDTNILLSNIDSIREIKGKVFEGKCADGSQYPRVTISFLLLGVGRATIFLPYIVLCELDKLKTHQDKVAYLARRAITFIGECFDKKDPCFLGQSAMESQKRIIPIKCGDDEILNYCLQLKEKTDKIILLSNDNNLRNKAKVNLIESYSHNLLLKSPYYNGNKIIV